MTEWQTIDTAPKDSIEGILVCRRGKPRSVMHVMVIDGALITLGGMTAYKSATHWMPLPQPPAQEE